MIRLSKSKDIPITCRGSLWGCEMLRIPYCVYSRLTDGGEVVSLTSRLPCTTHKHFFFCFWYLFLLEAEYISRPSAAGRIMKKKKSTTSLGLEHATFWIVSWCLNQATAYDSVRREILYSTVTNFGVTVKLVMLIKMCSSENKSPCK
jgi:hypothetical protein